MSQSTTNAEYSKEISAKNLKKTQADVLLELKGLSDDLLELLNVLKETQELVKSQPVSLRAVEGQMAPLLDHVRGHTEITTDTNVEKFKMALYTYMRTPVGDATLEDVTIHA